MKVPFNNLKILHSAIREEIGAAINEVIASSRFVLGKYVEDFEKEFAAKLGVKHCIGVGNGTDALVVVLKMLGIGAGDEVITAANTFIATSEAISLVGAKPVFVDHDEYYTIDKGLIEKKITSRTKAIIPVHLYGQAADLNPIKEICNKKGLYLIEDCAQSHFSAYCGKNTGTYGVAGTFSFYPAKNLGAIGDAGCIITNSDDLAIKIRMYCNHGSSEKHIHLFEGCNTRLDAIQAAVLKIKLKYIDDWNYRRKQIASVYNEILLSGKHVDIPSKRNNCDHIYHLYVIKAENRETLRDYLSEKGIQTGIHYPVALPFMPCYKHFGHSAEDFPRSFQNQSRLLTLPVYPDMSQKQAKYVADCVNNFYQY